MTRRVALLRSILTLLLGIGGLCASASVSSAVTIDFETLPGGGLPTSQTDIDSAYSSLGVIFGSLEPNDLGRPKFNNRSGSATNPVFWAADNSRDLSGTEGFHILTTFTTPVSSVAANTLGPSAAEFTVIATAFDINGFLLGSVETAGLFGALKGELTLDGLGPISSVVWKSNQPFLAGVQIDDLAFTVVPEPASAVLIGLGLGVLAHSRNRQRGCGTLS